MESLKIFDFLTQIFISHKALNCYYPAEKFYFEGLPFEVGFSMLMILFVIAKNSGIFFFHAKLF